MTNRQAAARYILSDINNIVDDIDKLDSVRVAELVDKRYVSQATADRFRRFSLKFVEPLKIRLEKLLRSKEETPEVIVSDD